MSNSPLISYQEITPKAHQLQQLIKLYYVHQSKEDALEERIVYFPNYTTTINIYKDSKLSWNALSRTHEPDIGAPWMKLLVAKFDRSREIIMRGPFHKLSIVFQPLGINHFLEPPLSQIAEDHFTFFDYFGPEFDALLDQVFELDQLEAKRDLLDDFFIKNYVGFSEDRLKFAVQEILDNEASVSIQQLSETLQISRKTLLRLFKKHLAISPTDYKSIVKFRKALLAYQDKKNRPSLADLAYTVDYYDQSDLNFHFKQKTGQTPQELFKILKTIEKDLFWQIAHVPKVQDKQ
ncbi:MAG: AraC family transcriptional regulator [Bacteroidota bacterium]